MSRLKVGLIVVVIALLFGGVAVFYFFNTTKTNQSKETQSVVGVDQDGIGQVPETCIKPKTFAVTQRKKIEEYKMMVGTAIRQSREQGASEEEIRRQTEQLTKSITAIGAAEQALLGTREDQPDYFQLNVEQEPGKKVVVAHVELQKPGFVVVSSPLIIRADGSEFNTAHFLQSGVYNNLAVPLSRYMDRYEAYVSLYEDDGDQTFDRSKDRVMTYRKKRGVDEQIFEDPAIVRIRFKSDRSFDEYQSVYLQGNKKWEGLEAFEQVPGKLATVTVARSYVPAWVAIHESKSGCAGTVLGVHSLIDEPEVIVRAKNSGTYTPELAKRYEGLHRQRDNFDIPLSREVKNETVFAVMYEDNGDGRFDLTTDKPLKGINDEAVGIEFPVIQGR